MQVSVNDNPICYQHRRTWYEKSGQTRRFNTPRSCRNGYKGNKINEVRKTELRGSAGWIHSIGPFGMKQGLEEFKPCLNLGNPSKAAFIHIGGTNGKIPLLL